MKNEQSDGDSFSYYVETRGRSDSHVRIYQNGKLIFSRDIDATGHAAEKYVKEKIEGYKNVLG